MTDLDRLDRLRDRRGGRGTKRVGVIDYSQYISGSSALTLNTPEPKPVRAIYRVGNAVTLALSGVRVAAKIAALSFDWTAGETVFLVSYGLNIVRMGYAALIEAIEQARELPDSTILQLPARVFSLVLGYAEPEPPAFDWGTWKTMGAA